MRKEKFTIKKSFDEMCKETVSILQKYYGDKSSLVIEKKGKEMWYYPLEQKLAHDPIRGFYIRVVKLNNSTTHIDVVDDGSDKFPYAFTKNMAQSFINELFIIYTKTYEALAKKN